MEDKLSVSVQTAAPGNRLSGHGPTSACIMNISNIAEKVKQKAGGKHEIQRL
jgi:hypothetical protein